MLDHERGARRADVRELARLSDRVRCAVAGSALVTVTRKEAFGSRRQEVDRAHACAAGMLFCLPEKRRTQSHSAMPLCDDQRSQQRGLSTQLDTDETERVRVRTAVK